MAQWPGSAFVSNPRHFICGEWTKPLGNTGIDVEDPSTGRVVGAVAAGCAGDVDLAVAAAHDAMTGPSKWMPTQRQDALLALAAAIDAHAEEFAQIEMLDAGKPISNARRVDAPASASILRYFAGWATKLSGETVEMSQPGNWRGFTLREPVGVVGQIIPWNYPLMGAAFKIGPAIAAGCAVVLKPAEQTSVAALKLAQLTEQCGFPPGFVNVVTGYGAEAGRALVNHSGVSKISFTGSTVTGREIAASCGRQMKRVTVELGGKSPVIVMPDANLDVAAHGIAMNIFFNTGQTCSAGSRLFVHGDVRDVLLGKIADFGRAMKIGPTDDPETQLGPAISVVQRDKINGFIEDALADGAQAICGGEPVAGQGYYVQPTVLNNVGPGMAVVDQEIFGPVLCAMPFETTDLDEISAMANASEYGLSAYVWTQDLAVANGFVDRLKAGTVRINSGGGGDLSMPAGGMKQSGFGRENGRAGVEAYTELKSVTMSY